MLQVYNWDAYFYKKVLKAFEDEYDVKVEWTTFNNMEEGIQKLVAGQVTADVFFPTTDYIRRLVASDNLQPLNHELIPNLVANVWPVFSDPGPWYDLEARYTVPVRDLHDGRRVPPRPGRGRAGRGARGTRRSSTQPSRTRSPTTTRTATRSA